jgi:uncharacterized protein YdaU (DUF1376 family)
MHYYQHHIGDFIKDTSYLTNEEVGIYLKLLWLYYDTEQPLTKDLFNLSMKVNARENEETVQGILGMFFQELNDGWHHTRCDKEIAEYRAKIDTASKAGKASAVKRASNDRSTTVQPTINHKPLTINHKPLTINHKPIKNITPPSGVDVSLWEDYLKVRKAAKKPLTETALKGLVREAEKAKMSLADVLQTCCENSWVGFKAEWLNKAITTKDKPAQKWDASIEGLVAKGKELGILPRPGETEGQYRERVKSGFA